MEKLSNLPSLQGWKKQGASRCWSAFTPARGPSGLERPLTPMGGSSGRMLGILQSGLRGPCENRRGRRQDRAGRLGARRRVGELIAFASLPCDSVTVVCEADCVIVFLPQAQLASCGKSCACHRQLLENLLSSFRKGLCPERAGGGALLPEHPGEAAVLLPHPRRGGKKPVLFPALYSERPGGVSVCGPQRHDAGTEKAAGGRLSGSQREAGAVSFGPAFGKADLCAASWK